MSTDDLIHSELSEMVERARTGSMLVRTGDAIRRVRMVIPDCQLEDRHIADIVAIKAIEAGAAVLFTPAG